MTANSPVTVGDVLKGGEEISVNLTISYAEGTTIDNYPNVDITVSFNDQSLIFIQDDGQGVSQGGGNESPVAQTWDKYYYYGYQDENYNSISTSTFDETKIASGYPVYVRGNTTSGKYEMCIENTCYEPTPGEAYSEISANPYGLYFYENGAIEYGDGYLVLCSDGQVAQDTGSSYCD